MVKLPAAQAAALVAGGEAVPLRSGGRQMKEWVAVDLPAPPASAFVIERTGRCRTLA